MVAKQKGFTLIELMLATSLLMLVLFAGYYGYGLFTEKWQKRTQFYWQQTQQSLAFDAISRVFESAAPYIVTSDNNEPAQYFSGDENRVMFITNSPLFSEKTSVVEFKILQNEDSFSLVYNEASMEKNLLLRQSDEIFWQHQVILMDKLESVSFDYYGWQSFSAAVEEQGRDDDDTDLDLKLTPSSYKQHIMEERRVLPISLNFNIKDQQGRESHFPVALPSEAYTVLVDYLRLEV